MTINEFQNQTTKNILKLRLMKLLSCHLIKAYENEFEKIIMIGVI